VDLFSQADCLGAKVGCHTVLPSSDELLRWQCHDDSTINIGINSIYIIIVVVVVD